VADYNIQNLSFLVVDDDANMRHLVHTILSSLGVRNIATAATGDRAFDLELPEITRESIAWHRAIMEAEMGANLDAEWTRGRDRLSASLRAQLERGRAMPALDYQQALARIPMINARFEEIFDRCDAILTPAAPGTAPSGLDATGDPSFCTLWTLAGMPAISLPVLRGGNGLPLGVQLVGRRGRDAGLLRTARWLVDAMAAKILRFKQEQSLRFMESHDVDGARRLRFPVDVSFEFFGSAAIEIGVVVFERDLPAIA